MLHHNRPPGKPAKDSGLSAGLARRDAAHDQHERDHGTTLLMARRQFAIWLLHFGEGTADDVQDLVELPPTADPRLLGNCPLLFARRGWIRADGQVRSRRPQAHARWVMRWLLVDATALTGWLRDHPMPEPAGVAG